MPGLTFFPNLPEFSTFAAAPLVLTHLSSAAKLHAREVLRSDAARDVRGKRTMFRDFKDTAYPFFESDTLFLECVLVSVLVL